MSVDADLQAFLELAEFSRLTGKSQAMHQLSLEQARRDFENTSLLLDPEPPQDLRVSEQRITCRDGYSMPVRVYRHGGSTPRATLLYLHGGGYVVGSLDSHDCVCRRLAALGDYAVVAPAYRLAPEKPFPTALFDCQDAADWLHHHAADLGLDASRVVLAGDSVGATLASVVAIMAADSPRQSALTPVAQLLFYPVTDCSQLRPSHQRYAEGYLLETRTLGWFYNHYLPAGHANRDWRVSPLLHDNLPTLAPAYINLAQHDPLFDEGQAYADKLKASGTATTLRIESGLTHDFLRMSGITSETANVYTAVGQWLHETL
mgnify:CR=1 FL=1